jgi:hypothetical protein
MPKSEKQLTMRLARIVTPVGEATDVAAVSEPCSAMRPLAGNIIRFRIPVDMITAALARNTREEPKQAAASVQSWYSLT